MTELYSDKTLNFSNFLSSNYIDIQNDGSDKPWIEVCLKRFNGYPNLEQLWKLMDEVWIEFGCDKDLSEANLSAFYSHPIWLLNGLFIEQDQASLSNRRCFVNYVVSQSPARVADIGGGFGTLARMIGEACPNAQIEIIEPHPHPEAIRRVEEIANVTYCPQLSGDYDLLIATDVFEHVPDPIALVQATAKHLKLNGNYLIANCFYPVILCHLPETFHFRYSWNQVLEALGLEPGKPVAYGFEFNKRTEGFIDRARSLEKQSQRMFGWFDGLPILRGKVRFGRFIFSSLARLS
jgi:hypothetical protein